MELTKEYILRVAKEFFEVDSIIDIQVLKGGHINSTYLVVFPECRYILQQINKYVFYSPQAVMNNMILLTNYIMKKCVYDGKSRNRAGLNLVPTRYDQFFAIVDDEYWRCTEFIEGGICYESTSDEHVFKEVGKAVGNFHYMLQDFHTRLIDDPIKNFHDTPIRYQGFLEDIAEVDEKLLNTCRDEIAYIESRKDIMDSITKGLKDGTLKRRVCHNDTKLSNVMMDEKTGKYMCLIDLDTAMKGALAYDFGDALRCGASTAVEDEVDLDKVTINLDLARAFIRGFINELKPRKDKVFISPAEVKSLYDGYYIITLELGMRFLDDYLIGNKYFRIDENRPYHNLERARNQLKLAKEIESHKQQIIDIINEALVDKGFGEEYLIK